ncbi:glycine zipper 2TM domain-containing protein [Pontixanthobacter aestiaquae]|uniref:17 kDa surface antigen n=1 Tax=Pontixanthobacter aestiaquae TaxID=1509367 RepID=A0A844Z5N0_9SPHN|nr:glycine zipper 2TM domain-containing protein [Pontixanthobacter aestiaquae]MDN3646905.1 glycine zipper 2TM domain-containing protein [Pontixanthobacter aestiaquae]MXO82113.1 glycine zipper 2TM domain-containing protein [Pontixanthobacter aestiaquae]
MTIRLFISTGSALGALVIAAPSLAQGNGPEMTYEDRQYEYAQPAPSLVPQPAPITYRQEAVVQPLPERATYAPPVRYVKKPRYVKDHAGADYDVEYEYDTAKRSVPAPQYHAPKHAAPAYLPTQAPAYPQHYQPQQPQFDRAAWMDECVGRISGRQGRRDSNGNIIGGLVGAAAGGLIGNRVAGRGDRLAGTLIGAGVGGLAGLAVGSAIDGKNSRKNDDAYAYCEDWLARYSGGHHGYGYQQYSYAYHAQPMMLVPVWVQVPQRAVTKEYVTYEHYEEEVVTYEEVPAKRRMIESHPAPATKPVKRTYVKQAQPVKYSKGN